MSAFLEDAVRKYLEKKDREEYWSNLAVSKWGDNVGEESRKTWYDKCYSGFFDQYMYGNGLDIGFSGYLKDVHPILPLAIGIDTNYSGYDGKTLPFENESQDFLYSSHCLEHISDYKQAIQEWYRVLKIESHMILVVPHRDLYEKKLTLPSRFNEDHKRFYQTSDLVREIEESLPINSYRIRYLRENDEGHNYSDPPEVHGKWLYEVEIVIEKIA